MKMQYFKMKSSYTNMSRQIDKRDKWLELLFANDY